MGLFRKKSDPISRRAKTLNQQIAALQQQERELRKQRDDFKTVLYRSTALVLLLGTIIAVGCVLRLSSLERR